MAGEEIQAAASQITGSGVAGWLTALITSVPIGYVAWRKLKGDKQDDKRGEVIGDAVDAVIGHLRAEVKDLREAVAALSASNEALVKAERDTAIANAEMKATIGGLKVEIRDLHNELREVRTENISLKEAASRRLRTRDIDFEVGLVPEQKP